MSWILRKILILLLGFSVSILMIFSFFIYKY